MKTNAGLIGMPVKHSLSPIIHQALHPIPYHLYETLDIDSVLKDETLVGLNVTAPLKEKAFAMAAFKDIYALKTKAVNTLVKRPEGLHGYNTDVLALIDVFQRFLSVSTNTLITIIGNGATEKSVRCALEELGYFNIQTVARHPKNHQISWHEKIISPEVLIQTTPLGMGHLEDRFPLEQFDFSATKWILDVVYAPLQTPLIQTAQRLKIPHLNGLPMLIRQAYHAGQLLTGQKLAEEGLQELEKKLIKQQENIVIIGMPYSGKTTLGNVLASALQKPFIDTDAIIEHTIEMPISDFIRQFGEPSFRAHEKAVIKTLKNQTSAVIATGGGTILDTDNNEILKRNGCFLFLDTPTPRTFDHRRPLTADLKTYLARKKERQPIYQALSDITLKGYQDPKEYIKEFTLQYEKYLNLKRS